MGQAVILEVSAPPWGTLKKTLECTGITRNWLLELVEAGEVRKKKRNGAAQGRAVYCIADVLDFLGRDESRGEDG